MSAKTTPDLAMDFFETRDGLTLPVSPEFLLEVLNPTSPGTNYFDPPPKTDDLNEHQLTRIVNQCSETASVVKKYLSDCESSSFLDIGTGNGAIPQVVQLMLGLKSSIGIDPYLDGEHKTSWQLHDHKKMLQAVCTKLGFEYNESRQNYSFYQIGAYDLDKLSSKVDFMYCKAIEHIPDWNRVFESMSCSASSGAYLYLKHRSFFGYLGPHRYATTFIPWGHLLLSDEDYKLYVQNFHSDRHESMLNFYMNGLARPRLTVNDMIAIAANHGFTLVSSSYIAPNYLQKALKNASLIPDFDSLIKKKWPTLSLDELHSSISHIVFKFNA